ncbi:MAG: hypothetical protein QM535_22470 [Limnohabitans sp.]|nr:hypothetical protein [Limnohabitans sp.]
MSLTKEQFLELSSRYYDNHIKDLDAKSGHSLYELEKNIFNFSREFSNELLQKQIGAVPKNHRKKKV